MLRRGSTEMTGIPIRVLIVEDNPADAELLELQAGEGRLCPERAAGADRGEMQAALDAAQWDLILSDYMLPRFSGLQALELLKATGRDIRSF